MREPFDKSDLRRLCVDFSHVEGGDYPDTQAKVIRDWISQFAIPVSNLPERPAEWGPHFSFEGIDIFMRWVVSGDAVYGYPMVPNATDSDLPQDKSLGYRIPLSKLPDAP